MAPKIKLAASSVDSKFAEVYAIILPGIVAKGKLKRSKS